MKLYKKIDIFRQSSNGKWEYFASTNRYKTCKAAKGMICNKYGYLPESVACYFAK